VLTYRDDEARREELLTPQEKHLPHQENAEPPIRDV
jgi:hypothetical protein